MRFAIISDIHDNLVNLAKCFNWCQNNDINGLICCGDVANSETLKIISQGVFEKIYLVRGNLEIYEEEEIKNYSQLNYLGRFGSFVEQNITVGVCHEPWQIKNIKEKCDIIFYGHTHKPWIEEKDGVKIINPGTLGGVFQRATFATWDSNSGELELKILELI